MGSRTISPIRAVAWDVFGTLVDWRGSIAAEGRRIVPDRDVDWDAFAVAWSKEYARSVAAARAWANLDVLLVAAFHRLAPRYGLYGLDLPDEIELATAWSRLAPWPDAVAGFARLSGRVKLAAFTNANHAMLADLVAATCFPFTALVSAEQPRAYKPDPAFYRTLAFRTDGPEGVVLAASHGFDLDAGKRAGFMTALVSRPGEPGSDPSGLDHEPDFVAPDVDALATLLLARVARA